MRGCAIIMTTITELRPAMAPTSTSIVIERSRKLPPDGLARPRRIATTIGAGEPSICWYGTRPTITPDTRT